MQIRPVTVGLATARVRSAKNHSGLIGSIIRDDCPANLPGRAWIIILGTTPEVRLNHLGRAFASTFTGAKARFLDAGFAGPRRLVVSSIPSESGRHIVFSGRLSTFGSF
jgi:hypothetical protein